RLRRRAVTRPGFKGAFGSILLSAASMSLARSSRSFCSGCGFASSGGISWFVSFWRTPFHALRSLRIWDSVVYLTRLRSALGLPLAPWQLLQYLVRRGWMDLA